MQAVLERTMEALREAGNGSAAFIPLSGGGALRVTYLWGKFGVVKVEKGATIPLPARRGGGSRISLTAEVAMGEWAAYPPTPVQLALGDEFLPLAGGSDDG